MMSGLAMYVDPVCGMTVDEAAGVGLHWGGRDYRFCEVACRDIFQDEPARWEEPLRHLGELTTHV